MLDLTKEHINNYIKYKAISMLYISFFNMCEYLQAANKHCLVTRLCCGMHRSNELDESTRNRAVY